jgi:glycine/D-amino acid oxidase-like deaminating enzyme
MVAMGWVAMPGSLVASEVVDADICVYGGTAGGVAAAVQAARMGKTVVLVEAGDHLGGMSSGGLGATDIGNKSAIGGIGREFYQRVAQHYAKDSAWRLERREDYFARRDGRSGPQELNQPNATMWTFEPHVAEEIFFQMVDEAKTPVYLRQRAARGERQAV